jgi:hypothetical protein
MKPAVITLVASSIILVGAGITIAQVNRYQCITSNTTYCNAGCLPYGGVCDEAGDMFDAFLTDVYPLGSCYAGSNPCDNVTPVLACSTIYFLSFHIPDDPGCDMPNPNCPILYNYASGWCNPPP